MKVLKKLFPVIFKDYLKLKITQSAKKWLDKDKPKYFFCNICKSYHSGFLPYDVYGVLFRKYIYHFDDAETFNYQGYFCPKCGSNDRERFSYEYWSRLFETIDQKLKYSFLDFAPSGQVSEWLRNNKTLNYRSADLFLENVDDKVDIQNMDIYQNETFNFMMCSHVLEHVEDDVAATKELYRILKKGGKLLVLVPINLNISDTIEDKAYNTEELRWMYYGQGDHLRLYSKTGFLKLLKNAGFKIEEISSLNYFGQKYYYHGISHRSIIYIASK